MCAILLALSILSGSYDNNNQKEQDTQVFYRSWQKVNKANNKWDRLNFKAQGVAQEIKIVPKGKL